MPLATVEEHIADMLFAAIVYQVSLYINLLIRLEKDVSPELADGLDACSRVLDLLWQPPFVMGNVRRKN